MLDTDEELAQIRPRFGHWTREKKKAYRKINKRRSWLRNAVDQKHREMRTFNASTIVQENEVSLDSSKF